MPLLANPKGQDLRPQEDPESAQRSSGHNGETTPHGHQLQNAIPVEAATPQTAWHSRGTTNPDPSLTTHSLLHAQQGTSGPKERPDRQQPGQALWARHKRVAVVGTGGVAKGREMPAGTHAFVDTHPTAPGI